MKRFCLILIITLMITPFCGCSGSADRADIDRVLNGFFTGLKAYDRIIMTEHLTEFPDNSVHDFPDDIFNDNSYVELYKSLYTDITYAVTNYEKNNVSLKVTMPDIGALYDLTCAKVKTLAENNPALKDKLLGDHVIFMQEMMRELAANGVEDDTFEFTLDLKHNEDKIRIVNNDELRNLLTGNFFSVKVSESEE
ncbi:MAG: hypothetical protein IJD67_00445 [Clostridia bacterium]|nr:hypothetical protein [Clostridia bacterium]